MTEIEPGKEEASDSTSSIKRRLAAVAFADVAGRRDGATLEGSESADLGAAHGAAGWAGGGDGWRRGARRVIERRQCGAKEHLGNSGPKMGPVNCGTRARIAEGG